MTVGEILELGKDAILADNSQLASQLVSRIYDVSNDLLTGRRLIIIAKTTFN